MTTSNRPRRQFRKHGRKACRRPASAPGRVRIPDAGAGPDPDLLAEFPLLRDPFCREQSRVRVVPRELFFKMNCRHDFCSVLEQAIDVYLYERKTSGYLEDDTFFSAYCLVNKVVREIWE